MKQFTGKSVFGGIAIGRLYLYSKGDKEIKQYKITDADAEMARFEEAKAKAEQQLQELYDKAVADVGEANAAIFQIHQMMLNDFDYLESIKNIITAQEYNAEYAVQATGDNFSAMFASVDDDYMKARAADVKDISERVVSNLMGSVSGGIQSDEPVIVIADDLAPSETVQMDKDKVLAFVTVHGSTNSHTAILARTMGIPALVGTEMELDPSLDGAKGVVDGNNGILYIEPDAETSAMLEKAYEEDQEQKRLLDELKDKECVTLDGRHIMNYANIGNVKDLALVLQNGAEGIGLFRSEFIYLESEDFPTEEDQFQIYKSVAETMGGRRVVIRTLDIGADKQCDYFNLDKEENPAMGVRAIRICLTRTEIFKTQLRALFRASAFGKIAIMYPMITSVKEVEKIKQIVKVVKSELDAEGIIYGEPEQGIMIETPAAAVISDLLAPEVDFFSIGTNDLTQYLLAIDRQNTKLDEFYDSHHPAVLRMIKLTAENAHKAGIWCGICGELGADLSLTKEFVKMGIDELSTSPGRILPIRKIIRELDTREF